MKKQTDTKIFSQIDELLARWRKEITEPMNDRPELVEEGIKTFYKKAGKTTPLILWCDSPLQTMLIPTLVSNVLLSDTYKTFLENMSRVKPADRAEMFKSEWTKVERLRVLPVLNKIWDFQYKSESATTQQKVLDRLAEHFYLIYTDGRLTPETILPKNCKKWRSGLYPGPVHFEMWRRFARLAAKLERKTTSEFSFSTTAAQGIFVGVLDHRAITKHIPIVNDFLSPSEKQKALLKRVQHIRSKCAELERMSATRAALLTEAATGFQRPAFTPEIDSKAVLEKNWQGIMWKNFEDVKKDQEQRQKDPRANGMILWSVSASWLPLALCCRLLDGGFLGDLEEEIDAWAFMFRGAAGYYMGDQVCFVCRHPKTLVTNDSGQPHSSFGAAATWSDGFDIHCWRGISVDPDLIKRVHEIRLHEILAEKNIETRRILLDMFGQDRFIQNSGATVINKDKCGTLYQYDFEADEPLLMVKVRNSTREIDGSYKDYFLRVPPNMTTAKEAVAWTFGLSESEYQPEFES